MAGWLFCELTCNDGGNRQAKRGSWVLIRFPMPERRERSKPKRKAKGNPRMQRLLFFSSLAASSIRPPLLPLSKQNFLVIDIYDENTNYLLRESQQSPTVCYTPCYTLNLTQQRQGRRRRRPRQQQQSLGPAQQCSSQEGSCSREQNLCPC